MPEVTKYIANQTIRALGTDKVYYVARCFRDETTTDATRLREFTQIGVEFLGPNPLDNKSIVRRDAIRLFRELLGETGWKLDDAVARGLNLYLDAATFEITSPDTKRQILGGGAYTEGAGWALGLERLQAIL